MTGEYLLMLTSRWLHILSATLAIGAPLYVRFVLMPAMGALDREIQINVDLYKMQASGLTFGDIQNIVSAENVSASMGA